MQITANATTANSAAVIRHVEAAPPHQHFGIRSKASFARMLLLIVGTGRRHDQPFTE